MFGGSGAGDEGPTRAEQRALRALEQAEVAAARGQNEDAMAQYRAAYEVWPDDPRVLAGLVRASIATGELEEAVAFDDRLRAQPASASRALAPLERCALWLGAARGRVAAERPDAAELLDRIEADDACARIPAAPVRAEAFALDAERAAEAGDTTAYIASLGAAVEADPARADLEATLARALLDAGRRKDAVRALSGALARHPESEALETLMLEALGLPDAGDDGET